jgi:opacity protein-like surface antigen
MCKKRLKVLSALLVLSGPIWARCQVSPAANSPRFSSLPFRIGAGYSNYGTDWSGRLGGPAAWIDFDLPKTPPSLSGLQLEAEGRDLNYTRSGGNPPVDPKLRQYTFAGGVNYAWRYDPAFHPYVKFLVGLGNVSFSEVSVPGRPGYTHDSRVFYAPGGGIDVRAHKRIWIRGDYEYQFWTDFFNHHTLTPHGFTIGVFYDFSRFALNQYTP